jgi:hypothetical protein
MGFEVFFSFPFIISISFSFLFFSFHYSFMFLIQNQVGVLTSNVHKQESKMMEIIYLFIIIFF